MPITRTPYAPNSVFGTGVNSQILMTGGRIWEDVSGVELPDGTEEVTEVSRCLFTSLNTWLPIVQLTPSQFRPWCYCSKSTWRKEVDFAVISATFTGIQVPFQGGELPDTVWEYDGTEEQVPIIGSPNFATLAGTAGAPQPGAYFDINGNFVEFRPPSPYVGLSAYLISNKTITKRWGTGVLPNDVAEMTFYNVTVPTLVNGWDTSTANGIFGPRTVSTGSALLTKRRLTAVGRIWRVEDTLIVPNTTDSGATVQMNGIYPDSGEDLY